MINKIQTSNISFGTKQLEAEHAPKKEDKRFLSNIDKYVKNSADMNDTITVPRTIFRGYLGVMAGTSLLTLGSFIKNPKNSFSVVLKTLGTIVSLYGTYAFVRPFLIKDKQAEQKVAEETTQEAPKPSEKTYKLVEVEQAK
ncbi:hypothetical protein IJC60_03160 [bacterium]|nr:hypothetical protein [bacterium]